jgi:hypothetical protein
MSYILVDATDRCRGLVVVADVTHELARQVFYRSEDHLGESRHAILGKPNFDLVKPTGVATNKDKVPRYSRTSKNRHPLSR